MFTLSKNHFSTFLALLTLSTVGSSLTAQDCCDSQPSTQDCCNYQPSTQDCCDYAPCNRFYIGGFGGELWADKTKIIQRGTAFFTEAQGGPLAVDARGHADKDKSTGFGGIQVGYEWRQCPYQIGCSNWNLTPGAELEAFWFRHERKGHVVNDSKRLDEHDFIDSFRLDVGVYTINGIINFNNSCYPKFTPYIGGGIGAARINLNKAKSKQIAPPQPGVNHFNSDRSDSDWAFAAQAKAGIRYNIWDRVHIFGEYRFLYLDSSRYLLGSTVYPTHAPTSPWDVDVKGTNYNGFAFGLQFDLF